MTNIRWPWQYSFPPFFTLQPNTETRMKQISAWRTLILDYHKNKNQYHLDMHEAIRGPPFINNAIKRKIDPDMALLILEDLKKTGNAAPCDRSKKRWDIYWHTLQEWSNIIYNWATENGMVNTVCTFFELTQGENTTNEEFFGMSSEVLIKVLKILEAENKCEIIMFDDNQGVKFF